LKVDPRFVSSVSMTTRGRRRSEGHGIDYHFVDRAQFGREVAAGGLVEWAEVYGNLYGTPKAPVEAALRGGRDVLFDIDWQGAGQIADAYPIHSVRVFILPPSAEALRSRLVRRAEDSDEVIARRLAGAAEDVSHAAEYDYLLVNEDLEACLSSLRQIVAYERARRLGLEVSPPRLDDEAGGVLLALQDDLGVRAPAP
jgi:guanylate kinase